MKLLNSSGDVINLPNDLLWQDELSWVPVVATHEYSLTGALLVYPSTKQAGRPITLEAPDEEMAWVPRSTVAQLLSWASLPDATFTLVFEYPTDTRTFSVGFNTSLVPVEAKPVKGFPQHAADDWFHVTIRLFEV